MLAIYLSYEAQGHEISGNGGVHKNIPNFANEWSTSRSSRFIPEERIISNPRVGCMKKNPCQKTTSRS
jgi:hypothetical protein